jgi:hypothetical protein
MRATPWRGSVNTRFCTARGFPFRDGARGAAVGLKLAPPSVVRSRRDRPGATRVSTKASLVDTTNVFSGVRVGAVTGRVAARW